MQGTRRTQTLSLDLDYAFKPQKIVKVWKNTVRYGLRKQALEDLHDFLDIHRNIQAFAERLRKDILDGYYKPSSPEFVHLEKRDGIPRRLAIPEPADALALQCIVEVLESELKKFQPSPNAYYSRTHTPGSVEQVDGTFAYPWWILWPQFQKRIWKFTNLHEYVVITDIANYFDCIPLTSLRNTLASCGQFSENLLNFLFYLLESFSWRPYYMPHSGVGLPQINFDAPRLLAHAYLFKLDEELESATNGNFVRWMDDVDAGVNSREEGKQLLRNLDNVLSSQGLRLNTSKSKILFAQDAVAHFWIQENRALTIIEASIKHGSGSQAAQKKQKQLLKKDLGNLREKHELVSGIKFSSVTLIFLDWLRILVLRSACQQS
ncbi:MAG: RNA-directed DNA polymerase [Cyanobacteria bacterium P01_D01_bin.6]